MKFEYQVQILYSFLMKNNAKHEVIDDPENPYKCVVFQLNHALPTSTWQSVVEGMKGMSDKMVLVTKKELISFAETQKLFVNTENMTEKQKNDKALIGLPRSANRAVMTEAFKRMTAGIVEQKIKERQIAQKALNDQKNKEKLSKQKASNKDSSLVQRNSLVDSVDVPPVQTAFDFAVVLEGYPFDISDFLSLKDLSLSLGYLANVSLSTYEANETLISTLANETGKLDRSIFNSPEVSLKESFKSEARMSRKFKHAIMLSDTKSLLKQACELDFDLQILEGLPVQPQIESFLVDLLKNVEENEFSKKDFIRDLKNANLIPIKLERALSSSEVDELIGSYQSNFRSTKDKIHNKRISSVQEIALILKSITKALDLKHGFPAEDLGSEVLGKQQVFQFQNTLNSNCEPSFKSGFIYDLPNQFGNSYELWKNKSPETARPSDFCELAMLAPFFMTNEVELSDKKSFIAVENRLRTQFPGLSNMDLFEFSMFEVISPASVFSKYLDYNRRLLFEETIVNPLENSYYKCMFNVISPVFTASKTWEPKNRFLPNFSFKKNYPSEFSDSCDWYYDIDVARFGKLSKRYSQQFNSKDCFITTYETQLKNRISRDFNVFDHDLTLLLRPSLAISEHTNYLETNIPFATDFFPKLPDLDIAEGAQKKAKVKDSDTKVIPIYPKTSVESSYFRKSATSELTILDNNSLISAICEIEAYFDIQKLSELNGGFSFNRLVNNPEFQSKISFGLSFTLNFQESFVKVLPFGDIFIKSSNTDSVGLFGRIITQNGYLIKYYIDTPKDASKGQFDKKSSNISSVEILHPNGEYSEFKNGFWLIVRTNGKRFKYTDDK
jgi:hypothetical protein